MKIIVIHLSDLHLKPTGNWILSRIEPIVAAATGSVVQPDGCFVVVSGDIAYSGQ